MRSTILSMALLCLTTRAWAERGTSPEPDVRFFIDDLATKSTHDAALESLKKLPTYAILPLFEAQSDESRPTAVRNDIALVIDAIASRERAAAAAEDNRLLLAWNANTTVNVYEKSGSDSKWDAAVRKGFSEFDRHDNRSALTSFSTAINSGCTDPLVCFDRDYCALLTSQGDRVASYAAISKSFQDFENSSYPDSRKCAVEASFAALATEPEAQRLIPRPLLQTALRRGLSHFSDLATDNPGRLSLRHVAVNLYVADGRLGGYGRGSSKDCVDALSAALPAHSLARFLEANFYVEWAWEARGNGFASSVTATGAKDFEERLIKARQAAEDGWRLNPLDPDCPAIMITICMGLGLGQKEMESWFARAMIADPHNLDACLNKERYLLPKWGGSVEESLKFGRYCVEHGNAQDRLPTILIRVYGDLLEFSPDADALRAFPEYWTDMKATYGKLLADKSRLQTHRDQYLADRAAYVKAACDAQRWKEATALMKEYGNDIDKSAMGGEALYDYFKQKAAEAAGEKVPGR